MDLPQREQLVAIARQHQLLIIEDAAYAFLAENPPAPLISLAPELTVYVSGLSKNVATGFRIGFIAAPERWGSTDRAHHQGDHLEHAWSDDRHRLRLDRRWHRCPA